MFSNLNEHSNPNLTCWIPGGWRHWWGCRPLPCYGHDTTMIQPMIQLTRVFCANAWHGGPCFMSRSWGENRNQPGRPRNKPGANQERPRNTQVTAQEHPAPVLSSLTLVWYRRNVKDKQCLRACIVVNASTSCKCKFSCGNYITPWRRVCSTACAKRC